MQGKRNSLYELSFGITPPKPATTQERPKLREPLKQFLFPEIRNTHCCWSCAHMFGARRRRRVWRWRQGAARNDRERADVPAGCEHDCLGRTRRAARPKYTTRKNLGDAQVVENTVIRSADQKVHPNKQKLK